MSIKEICGLFLVFRSLSTVTQEIRDPQLLKRLLHWCTPCLILTGRQNKVERMPLFFAVVQSGSLSSPIQKSNQLLCLSLILSFPVLQICVQSLPKPPHGRRGWAQLKKRNKSVGLFQNYIPSTYYRAFNSAMNSGLDRAFNQIQHQFMVREDCD